MSPQQSTAISSIESIQTKKENSLRAMTLNELKVTTIKPIYSEREEKLKKLVQWERQQLQEQLSPELCTEAALTAMSQGYMSGSSDARIDQRMKELGLSQ